MSINQKPKILIISRCSWTLFNFRLRYIQKLKDVGYDVYATGYDKNKFSQRLSDNGVNFISLGDFKNNQASLFSQLSYAWLLFKVLRTSRIDVIHHFTMQPVLIGTLVARLCSVKSICTITGLGHLFIGMDENPVPLHLRLLMINATNYSEKVIFQNGTDEIFLRGKKCIGARINSTVIMGSGVDIDKYHPVKGIANKKSSLTKKAFGYPCNFVMVSRLIKEKGIDEFCEMASAIHKLYPGKASFTVVGDIDKNNPSSYSKSKILELFEFSEVRYVPHTDDILTYLHEADVMVLPSYREGLSMSLLEGGSTGLPLVTNDVPGCRECVVHGETGFIVDIHDNNAFCKAIARLIEDPQLIEQFGKASREHISNNFSSHIIFDQLVGIIKKIKPLNPNSLALTDHR